MIEIGLTDHFEAPREIPSREVYAQTIAQTELADALGFEYAWFAEHHAHAHAGHLPAPLLLALHLAGRTRHIRLGTAIICLNLHHPLDVAEQVAVADTLMDGRLAVGFGSGSTPGEFALFGQAETNDADRHARFTEALSIITNAWQGEVLDAPRRYFTIPPHSPLPMVANSLPGRSWLAVNSVGAARVAGTFNFNVLFSHLRTPAQYRDYAQAYRQSGGRGKIAANRPVYVGQDEQSAWRVVEPALRILWRRFQSEGKIAASTVEPTHPRDLCAHPINFIVGDATSVARQLVDLHRDCPYDVANLEPRWAGLSDEHIRDCLRRLAKEVRPLLTIGKP